MTRWTRDHIAALQAKGLTVVEGKTGKKYRYYVGIDTGTVTGICFWDSAEKRIDALESMPIHRAMDYIKRCTDIARSGMLVRVEDARLRKWVPKMPTESRERGRREGAGYVKAHAAIWEAFLTDLKKSYGIEFEMVAPKNNKTKMSAEYFKSLTGWQGKTNDHQRDAAALVIGM